MQDNAPQIPSWQMLQGIYLTTAAMVSQYHKTTSRGNKPYQSASDHITILLCTNYKLDLCMHSFTLNLLCLCTNNAEANRYTSAWEWPPPALAAARYMLCKRSSSNSYLTACHLQFSQFAQWIISNIKTNREDFTADPKQESYCYWHKDMDQIWELFQCWTENELCCLRLWMLVSSSCLDAHTSVENNNAIKEDTLGLHNWTQTESPWLLLGRGEGPGDL